MKYLYKNVIWKMVLLQLRNYASYMNDKPSYVTQNFINVGVKLLKEEYFSIDLWTMDQPDLIL